MRKKVPEIDLDHQGQLVSLAQEGKAAVAAESFPHDGPADKLLGRPVDYDVTYGPEWSYKDLAERAEQLEEALAAFGLRNQRVGFRVASNSPRHNGPIHGRYPAGVPFVKRGAENNAEKYLREAKKSFWQATGYAAMRAAGVMNTEELNARATNLWEKFSARYGTPVNDEDRENTARKDFKARLAAQTQMAEDIKLRHAA